MKPFVLKLSVFSALLGIADFCWNYFMPERALSAIWVILGFFYLLTLSFHLVTLGMAKGEAQRFVRYYMGSTAIRMALCLAVVIIYRFIDKPGAIPFALAFMAHYLAFTVFEVRELLKVLGK